MPFKNHKSEGNANIMQTQGQSSILCAMALLLNSLFQKTPDTQYSAQDSHPSKVSQDSIALFSFSIPSFFRPHILQKKKPQQYLRIQQPNAKQASSGIPTESQEGLQGSGLFPKKEKCKKKELRKLLCLNPWINKTRA